MDTVIANIKETKDLYLFAAYLAMGAEFISADRTDPKNIIFKVSMPFLQGAIEKVMLEAGESKRLLDKYEADWVNGYLAGNLVKYADAIKRAKAIVHSK